MKIYPIIILVSVGVIGVFSYFIFFHKSSEKKEIFINEYIDDHKITGRTYHVSPQGDDARDGLSPQTSFLTIQYAIEHLMPGDGIVLADGVYDQDIVTVRSGDEKSKIIITGSRNAVVRGTGEKARIVEINHDHIILKGFTIDGLVGSGKEEDSYRDKLIYIEGKETLNGVNGVGIYNMHLKNAGGECVRIKYFSQKNEVAYNEINGCGAYDFILDGDGKNGEGIYIGTAPEQVEEDKNITRDVDQSHHNWIHDNVIDTQGNECVDIKEGSSFNIVEHNVCTGQKDKESAGLDSRGSENIFRENEVYGCVGAGVRLGGDEDDDGIKNDVMKNNIHDNKRGGIKVQTKPQGRICENVITDNGDDDLVGEYSDDVENASVCS